MSETQEKPSPHWYDRAAMAELLGVSERTIMDLLAQNQIPKPLVQTDKLLRWGAGQVQRWLNGERVV